MERMAREVGKILEILRGGISHTERIAQLVSAFAILEYTSASPNSSSLAEYLASFLFTGSRIGLSAFFDTPLQPLSVVARDADARVRL